MLKKKSFNPFGIGVILFLLLILIFNFTDDSSNNNSILDNDKTDFKSKKIEYKIQNDVIFGLKNTIYGKSQIISKAFKNLKIGLVENYKTIYQVNSIRLISNPFSTSKVSFEVPIEDINDTTQLLFYLNPKYITGENEILKININNLRIINVPLNSGNVPISINLDKKLKSIETLNITLKLTPIPIYELTNWNKVDITEFKIIQKKTNKKNLKKEFKFETTIDSLETSGMNIYLSCYKDNDKKPIQLYLNENLIEEISPQCKVNENYRIELPQYYLNEGENILKFETESSYKTSFSIDTLYFNKKKSYTFDIETFDNLLDIVIYGEFNKEYLTYKINGNLLKVGKDEIQSIISYLNYGKNKITIVDEVIEIYDLTIEKSNELIAKKSGFFNK
jgi:hypothetical protein